MGIAINEWAGDRICQDGSHFLAHVVMHHRTQTIELRRGTTSCGGNNDDFGLEINITNLPPSASEDNALIFGQRPAYGY
ncbi:hypothetical protein D3C81_1950810 [compost metagenome]